MADLVLRAGTVVDGTGAPGVRADVRLAGGRIVAVGPDLAQKGDEIIACDGLVVAPGFIDTHSHSDLKLFDDPTLPMKIEQGVTLEILGQDGISVAPVRRGSGAAETKKQMKGLLGDAKAASWAWESVGDYLGALREAKTAPNMAYLVPHGTLRAYVMGADNRAPTADELRDMEAVLAASLDAGAIGLSTGLIYPPCCYAERAELTTLAKVAASRGGPLVVHMRSESDFILDAIAEMVDVGARAGCAIHISHWKIAGPVNFARATEVVAAVEAAQADGVKITCDQYPYAAGSTLLGAVLPPWAHDGGPTACLERLRDAAARTRMRQDMLAPPPQVWDNFWGWTGPKGIVISDVASGRRPELLGRTIADAAGDKDPIAWTMDLLRDEELGVGMISHSQSPTVVEELLTKPYVNVCTDGLLGGRPHPRAYGTYAKILGQHVRERKQLALEEAIRKMTSQAARAMNLGHVGQLAPGFAADVVVFDAAEIRDRATFEEPSQLAVGMKHVLVGGRPAAARGGRVVVR